jgi:hypothetical protein
MSLKRTHPNGLRTLGGPNIPNQVKDLFLGDRAIRILSPANVRISSNPRQALGQTVENLGERHGAPCWPRKQTDSLLICTIHPLSVVMQPFQETYDPAVKRVSNYNQLTGRGRPNHKEELDLRMWYGGERYNAAYDTNKNVEPTRRETKVWSLKNRRAGPEVWRIGEFRKKLIGILQEFDDHLVGTAWISDSCYRKF